MRRRTRGYGTAVLALAAFFPLVLLLCGFAPLTGAALGAISGVIGALTGAGGGAVALRLRALPRRYGPRCIAAFLAAADLSAAVLILGAYSFPNAAAWWARGAARTALPLIVLSASILRAIGDRR